ncbi:MAG: YceI family protein [Opitutaceae bacterium]
MIRIVATACLALGFSLAGSAKPPDRPRLMFRAQPASEIRIAGRATLGKWECSTHDIMAAVEPGLALEMLAAVVAHRNDEETACAPSLPVLSSNAARATPYANISIPVGSLQCDKPGMRRDVLRALKHEDAPLIVFVLTSLSDVTVLPRRAAELGRYRVVARGDLVLAGQLRPIDITADIVQEAPRRFRIDAEKSLRMSDFGLSPPTALWGALRADNEVTVIFHLVFEAIGP